MEGPTTRETTIDVCVEDILEKSKMRIGVKLVFPENAGLLMRAGFELTQLELTASGRPFMLIPD